MSRAQIPNLIAWARLLAVAVLWAFALQSRAGILGAGLLVAWATDALDGYLARRWNAVSARGSRLDSFADGFMFLSAIAWVAMLRPEFIVSYRVMLAVWLGLGVVIHAISWSRFRRLPAIHLLSAKAANIAGFLFIPYLIAYGTWAPPAAWCVIGVWLLAALETLWVVATVERPEEELRTVLGRARAK